MNTDKIIKEFSQKLNFIESTRKEQGNHDVNFNEFKEIMDFLEEKTEYLFMLKKQYNILYRKLNNLN